MEILSNSKLPFFSADLLSISTFCLIHTHCIMLKTVLESVKSKDWPRSILEFQIGQPDFEIGHCHYPVSKLQLHVPTDLVHLSHIDESYRQSYY